MDSIVFSVLALASYLAAVDSLPPTIALDSTDLVQTYNQSCELDFTLYDNVVGNSVVLRYRMGGERTFEREAALTSSTADARTFTIPAAFATPRGIDCEMLVSDGTNPTDTFHFDVRVRVPRLRDADALLHDEYEMVSVPLLPSNNLVRNVFSDDLGGYDPMVWRAVAWDAPSRAYDELTEDSPIALGEAYWVRTRLERVLVDIGEGLTTPTSVPYEIRLAPGWHAIGLPYVFAVHWQSIVDSTGADAVHLDGPYGWDGDWVNPIDAGTLIPWQGYYVQNEHTDTITLRIPSLESLDTTVAPFKARSQDRWFSKLKVTHAGHHEENDYLGVHSLTTATDARALTHTEPPSGPSSGSVRAAFVQESAGTTMRLMTDVRPSLDGGQGWRYTLSGLAQGERVGISFSNTDELSSSDLLLVVFDPARNATVDIGSTGEYVFHPAAGEKSRTLTVALGDSAYMKSIFRNVAALPGQFAMRPAYPNPFRARTIVHYAVPPRTDGAYNVTIAIYTLGGQRVRVLTRGKHDAGRYRVVWDGRDEYGSNVSSNLYLCRMSAGTSYAHTMRIFRLE